MTKMATMPIYGKKPLKIFFSRTKQLMILKLDMQYWVLEYYSFFSNDNTMLTFDLFMQNSTLVPEAFVWHNAYMVDYLETIEFCDIKIRNIVNEYMEIYMYQWSRSFFDLCLRSFRMKLDVRRAIQDQWSSGFLLWTVFYKLYKATRVTSRCVQTLI